MLDAIASSYVTSNGEALPGRAYAAVPVTKITELLGGGTDNAAMDAGARILNSMVKFNMVKEDWMEALGKGGCYDECLVFGYMPTSPTCLLG